MRSTLIRLVIVSALVAGAAVAAGGPADRENRADAATDPWAHPFANHDGVLFGAWIKRDYNSESKIKAAITQRETAIGRKLAIDHHFYTFSTTFPSWREPWDIVNGRIPMISWNGTDTSQIVNGSKDSLIRTRARAVKALNAPVFLRFFWEPENKLSLISSPTEYINAWRRVRSLFDAEGATNVVWQWCGTAWGMRPGGPEFKYYPGDAYVDWVCTDGYNWAPGQAGATWQSFAWIMKGAHDFSVAHNKPMIVGEFGVQERNPGEKAAWMADAQAAIKTSFPNIKAIVYFDEDRLYDWRVDTTTSSYNAYKAWMADLFYNPDPGSGSAQPPPKVLLSDDFEDATITDWTQSGATVVTDGTGKALKLRSTGTAVWARHALAEPTADINASFKPRRGTDVVQSGSVSLLTVRNTAGTRLIRVITADDGRIGLENVLTGEQKLFAATLWPGSPNVMLKVVIAGKSSRARLYLNGHELPLALTQPDLGTLPVADIELGERNVSSPVKKYSLLYDSVEIMAA
ncbi:MAG: hypothetical protein FJW88_03530 [Actinobacteria bacterium]|nr:hypothetical protein [Actinomycetota bacterium]